jgi:hypothetical protein
MLHDHLGMLSSFQAVAECNARHSPQPGCHKLQVSLIHLERNRQWCLDALKSELMITHPLEGRGLGMAVQKKTCRC